MRKRIVGTILVVIMLVVPIMIPAPIVEAATNYISPKDFIMQLVQSLKLDIDDSSEDPYLDAAVKVAIVKDNERDIYNSKYINRTDSAVFLNRADEYLHGDTVDHQLLDFILDKRISDIKDVPLEKRTDIAKCFAKGIIKGYSNGYYIQNRSFKGNEYLTNSSAKAYIKLLTSMSNRAKLTTEGLLIRTSNLPKYAKYYPYVLEYLPNEYYDWKFQFEGQAITDPETGISVPYKNIEDYVAPIDIDKIKDFDNFEEVKREYLDKWVSKVQMYMECVFNVDYKTINDNWVDKILSADYSNNNEGIREKAETKINQYITDMKLNKTIVESSKVAIDGSSLYYFDGRYILRVYVKYRIVSSNQKFGADVDTLINDNPYGDILFTRYPLVNLKSFKKGEWKEGYFEVEMGCAYTKEPDNVGVIYAVLNELLYDKRRVDK